MGDVRCGRCGTENRETAKFCGGCGGRLEQACSACGTPLPAGLKFCDECGEPTAVVADAPEATAVPDAARKLVTVAFVDLGGSTAFGEVVDAETARSVMGRYHSLVTETVGVHRGTVAKYIGDGVMVFFGVPEVAEDDAVRAVAFGADVQERFAPFAARVLDRHGAAVTLRVGINTGEIVIGEDDVDLYGDALNVAARLEKACPHGGVLVGEETWRLARGAFAFEAQGEVEVHGRAGGVRPHLLTDDSIVEEQSTPFVGRAGELDRLGRLFHEVVATRRPGLASVIGPPGVGKTRLSRELQMLVEKDDAVVYTTACDRDGDATLGPVADLLRPDDVVDAERVRTDLAALLTGEDDADRVVEGLVAVLGLATKKVSVEETFWALRRLVEQLGRASPVVVIVDDIQWASDQLLDLFEHLATYVVDTPLLLVTLARPEIRDLRPVFAEAGRSVDEVVLLTGLDAESTAALAVRLLGGDDLPRGLAERLPASTDGNPLFVREVVRMLVDEEIVQRDGDRWVLTVEPDAIDVPSTVQSLLAARVERLPAGERMVLERAAVIGPDFTRAGLEHLCTEADRSSLPQVLRSLTRKELIEATGSYWGDDPVHRFHHVLIRDAVYRRLLKETRAGLHERIGEWMARASADVLGEHDAAIGHHFEQAFRYRTELGDDDAAVHALGASAAHRLADAARVALRGDDAVAAGALARRALACLAPDEPTRPETLTLACEALLDIGDAATARPFIDELLALADLEPAFAGWAMAYDAQAITITEPGRLADAETLATEAVEALATRDDPAGEAKARLVRASILARRGRIGECEAELDAALTKARDAHDTRRVVAVLGVAPLAALWGPSPVARAGGRCLDVLRLLRITASSPAVEAVALRCQAVLEALRGRFDTAYSLIERARRSIAELGLRRELADIDLARGQIHLLAGDASAAEAALRTAHDELLAIGAGAEASQAAALLGRTLVRLGRNEEVEELVDEAERLAGENLKAAILGRTVRAEWLLATGRTNEARAVAERAVAIAEATDLVLDHAEACDVLAASGHLATTAAAELRARKGVATPDPAAETGPSADDDEASKVWTTDLVSGRSSTTDDADGPDDPLDRLDFIVPELRRVVRDTPYGRAVAGVGEAWRNGDDDRLAWFYGRDDVVVDNRKSTVNSGVTTGAEAAELMRLTRAFFPVVEHVEILAVRGPRLGLAHGLYSGGDAVEEFLLVGEIDPDGRIVRQLVLDPDAIAEADAVLDEWFWSSEEAVFERQMTVGRRLMDAQHDPSRRDDLRDVLHEDFSYRYPAVLGDRTFGRDEYIELVRSFMDTDDHEVDDWQAWTVWGEPLSERVLLAVVRRRARMADGTTPEWLWVGVNEIHEGRIRRFELLPVEELERARRLALEWNRAGAFGDIPAPLVGVPFVDASRWNDAVRWRLRTLAFFNDRDRDPAKQIFRDDARISDRRPMFRSEFVGRDEILAYGASLFRSAEEQLDAGTMPDAPFRLTGVLDVAGDRLCLTAEFIVGVIDNLHLIEIDEAGLLLRTATFEAEQLDEARAALDEWHTEAASPGDAVRPADGTDPLGRITFPFPELRAIVESTPYATIADLVEAPEILAIRGPRHGASRGIGRDAAGNRSEVIAVHEVDDDGRVIRRSEFEPDAVIEAVELLEEWYVSSPGVLGREATLAGSSILHSTGDPTRRDELLDRLDDDVVFRMMSGSSLLDDLDRDAFLAVQDALVEQAERVAFWGVWSELVADDVVFAVLRRLATMPDGSTAEWLVATANLYRDGRLLLCENFDIGEYEQARRRAAELAALGSPWPADDATLSIRPHRIATTDPGGTPHVSTEFPGETQALSLREVNDHLRFVRDQRAAGVRDERVVGPTRERFAPDFRRIDHRPLGTDVLDGGEAERSTQVLADLGFVMAGVVAVAARGEHHTLGIASLLSDDNEMLSGVGQRYRPDGLISLFDVFDPSDALAAYHRMLDRYLADENEQADPGWVALDRAFVDALAIDDRSALRAIVADDFRAVVAGRSLDVDAYATALLDVRAALPGTLTWIANIRVAGDRALVEIVTADLTVGLSGHEWFDHVIWERRDSRIVSAEHHRDVDVAFHRFLRRPSPDKPVEPPPSESAAFRA